MKEKRLHNRRGNSYVTFHAIIASNTVKKDTSELYSTENIKSNAMAL
jgi:hypothetical protein